VLRFVLFRSWVFRTRPVVVTETPA
jgi:hypothetical protein